MSTSKLSRPGGEAGEPKPASRRWIGWILALALALRLAHWLAVGDHPFVAWPVNDSQTYERWASEVASGGWLGSGAFFQAPLYPYVLGVVFRLGGHHLALAYWLQALLSVAACYALYRAGRAMEGEGLGLAADSRH